MLGPEGIFRRVEAAFGFDRSAFLAKSYGDRKVRAARAACIVLLHDDGFSQPEIARILQRDASTITVALFRARRYGMPHQPADVRASYVRAVEAP